MQISVELVQVRKLKCNNFMAIGRMGLIKINITKQRDLKGDGCFIGHDKVKNLPVG